MSEGKCAGKERGEENKGRKDTRERGHPFPSSAASFKHVVLEGGPSRPDPVDRSRAKQPHRNRKAEGCQKTFQPGMEGPAGLWKKALPRPGVLGCLSSQPLQLTVFSPHPSWLWEGSSGTGAPRELLGSTVWSQVGDCPPLGRRAVNGFDKPRLEFPITAKGVSLWAPVWPNHCFLLNRELKLRERK